MFQPFLHPFLANVDDLRLAALFASIRSPFVDVHHPPARQPPATGPENSISGYRQSPSTLSPPPPFRATVKASKLHSNARLLVTAISESISFGARVSACLRIRFTHTKNEPLDSVDLFQRATKYCLRLNVAFTIDFDRRTFSTRDGNFADDWNLIECLGKIMYKFRTSISKYEYFHPKILNNY